MQAALFAQRALFVAHCDGVNHSSLQVPWYQACEYETRRIRPLKRRNAHELSDHKQGRPTEEPSDGSWEIDPSTARRNPDGT